LIEIRIKRHPFVGKHDPWVYGTHEDLGRMKDGTFGAVLKFEGKLTYVYTPREEILSRADAENARMSRIYAAFADLGFCPKTLSIRCDNGEEWS